MANDTYYKPETVARVKAAARLLGRKRVARITGIPAPTISNWLGKHRKEALPDPSIMDRMRLLLLEGN
jgi:hypothetical protein